MPKQNGPNTSIGVRAYPIGPLYRQVRLVMALALMLCMGFAGTVTAIDPSSDNYSASETQFGAGGDVNNCSDHYCSRSSVGDATVGNSKSDTYSAQFGNVTPGEPLLEVIVDGGNQDMGTVNTAATGTAVSTVAVRNYLSSGYTMQLVGAPPSQGMHALATLSTPTTSHQGAEQFGVNFAANTSPAIGAVPTQTLQDGSGIGTVADDYKTADLFKYVEGDIVALSGASSSETVYTMSIIMNISNTTPSGYYACTISAVVVPYY